MDGSCSAITFIYASIYFIIIWGAAKLRGLRYLTPPTRVVTVPPAVEAGSLLTTGPPVPRIQFEQGIPGEWNWPLNYPMMSQSMFFAFRQTWFYPVSHRSVWLSLKEPIKSDKRPSKMELHRGCWQGEKHLDSMIFKWFSCLFLSNGIHYSNKMLLEIS